MYITNERIADTYSLHEFIFMINAIKLPFPMQKAGSVHSELSFFDEEYLF